ncbi:hypothetical protein [Kitasatospora viridis]|uniref:Uncharacterized protein n=1 Tax=Kitasatospora viridis TaxID=281105 RepID=A0A561TWE0_9ACTN|nr:hypothetical protein [Kitasatospora viridis]TWF91428.1 hypothetical protein FHX73_12543 [Kitasatospora viridis]
MNRNRVEGGSVGHVVQADSLTGVLSFGAPDPQHRLLDAYRDLYAAAQAVLDRLAPDTDPEAAAREYLTCWRRHRADVQLFAPQELVTTAEELTAAIGYIAAMRHSTAAQRGWAIELMGGELREGVEEFARTVREIRASA